MPKCEWRGECYIYNHALREFLVYVGRAGKRRPSRPDSIICRWSPAIMLAKRYKNPGIAHKTAARINADHYASMSAKYPCAPVQVVTGEAARCLDQINRRDHHEKTEIRHP